MTKREMFQRAIEVIGTVEVEDKDVLIEGLKHEIDLLANRKSGKGLTKTQKENEGVMDLILVALDEIGSPVTVTDLIKAGEGLDGYTNQKISALLRKLVEAGKVSKSIEGKKAVFSIV